MSRIPQFFIDDLIARTDIVALIDERVPLRQQGANHMACCPFHDEKTASFSVSSEKQFYYCFGCGAHGTAIGFLMDYAQMDFPDAIRELATRAGVEVPEEEDAQARSAQTKPLYDILEKAGQFFTEQLRSHPQSDRAVEYLKSRDLNAETAAVFDIGYAPPGWDNLLKSIGSGDSARKLLEEAGLTISKSGGSFYDRFRDRIMFPIRDRRGRVIGFGGRTLGDEKPKYLNSPETPVFHKGRELYGLFEARKVRDADRLIVVEGYTDVVALAQYGIRNAVATLGTATSTDHVALLFRQTGHIVYCFDGDEAGKKGAWRAMENTLGKLTSGRQASFLFLPEGEDPDSLIRQIGADEFQAKIDAAKPLSDFLFETLGAGRKLDSVDGRAGLADQAIPLVQRIPPGNFHDLMLRQLDSIAGTTSTPSRPAQRLAAARLSIPKGQRPSAVRTAIALLLRRPGLAAQAGDVSALAVLENPGIPLLLELISFISGRPDISCAGILENWRDTETGRHLVKLAATEALCPDDGLETEFTGAIDRLWALLLKNQVNQLLDRERQAPLSELEKQELGELLRRQAGTPTRTG